LRPPAGPARLARRFLEARFPGAETRPLQEEASGRIYLRVEGRNAVLMVRPDAFLPDRDPYCRATAMLEACGVRAPRILEARGAWGLMLLEDCGDDLLSRLVASLSPDEISTHWGEALDTAARIRRGTRFLSPAWPAGRLWLGPERMEWELLFFHRHWIQGMRRAPLSVEETATLRRFYRSLARQVWEDLPPALCHRDYHARNLLRHPEGGLVVTDHQDSRWGPPLYDLASLVRDPYVKLPEGLEEEMLETWARQTRMGPVEALRPAYERTALQRNLKAAGTYACQVTVHGREGFRESLAPTLSWARTALARLPEYGDGLGVLEGHALLAPASTAEP
jgi:aminoglycoside/choline kinase family phosphotransferase